MPIGEKDNNPTGTGDRPHHGAEQDAAASQDINSDEPQTSLQYSQRQAANTDGDQAQSSSKHNANTRYYVHSISGHKINNGYEVDLLVNWGGGHADAEPTWEPEERLWEDCKDVVLKYWAPNGCSTRTRKLGLHKYNGPFVVGRVLGKKVRGDQTLYKIEWIGYRGTTWEPGSNLSAEIVKTWENRRIAEE